MRLNSSVTRVQVKIPNTATDVVWKLAMGQTARFDENSGEKARQTCDLQAFDSPFASKAAIIF